MPHDEVRHFVIPRERQRPRNLFRLREIPRSALREKGNEGMGKCYNAWLGVRGVSYAATTKRGCENPRNWAKRWRRASIERAS
ncbi:MAG: hypothetical protein Fur005_26840 [Roseiflexaceae bacterium]